MVATCIGRWWAEVQALPWRGALQRGPNVSVALASELRLDGAAGAGLLRLWSGWLTVGARPSFKPTWWSSLSAICVGLLRSASLAGWGTDVYSPDRSVVMGT